MFIMKDSGKQALFLSHLNIRKLSVFWNGEIKIFYSDWVLIHILENPERI